MKSIAHVLTILGCIIAVWSLSQDLLYVETVYQQIAAYCSAFVWVIIPYCFARAVEQLAGR